MSECIEQLWGLVNANRQGKPILVADSLRWSKRRVKQHQAMRDYRRDFTVVRVTVTFTDPREAR